MCGSTSFGRVDVKFSGTTPYTLTTSLVASDAIDIKFVKKFSVYSFYTPGAGGTGNSINYQVEINPFYAKEDPNDLYWAPIGRFIDTSGQYAEEKATFNSSTSTTAATQYNEVPLDIIDPAAARVRIKVKETVVGGSAGTVRLMLGTNTIN